MRNGGLLAAAMMVIATSSPGWAHADNTRLNSSVIGNIYTIHRQAGCRGDLGSYPPLQLAAQWHTQDMMANRELDGDIGSDGSTPESRAAAAGYAGQVAETVMINPALAVSGLELLRAWYFDPQDLAIMQNCAFTQMGVWSENGLDRTVVVAMYGAPR